MKIYEQILLAKKDHVEKTGETPNGILMNSDFLEKIRREHSESMCEKKHLKGVDKIAGLIIRVTDEKLDSDFVVYERV